MQFDVNIRLFEYSEADLEGRAGRAPPPPPPPPPPPKIRKTYVIQR
jgi:hypothetical protein